MIKLEQTDEYKQGRIACYGGKPNNENPYDLLGRGLNDQRVWWFIGWYDERNKKLLGLEDIGEVDD